MIPFSVRKLYVDVVDERGTIWIFYFLALQFGLFRQRLAGAEMYPCPGGPICARAVRNPAWPAIDASSRTFAFWMELDNGPVRFSATSLLPPWAPGGPRPVMPIRWRVVAPRLDVQLQPPGTAAVLRGVGYSDFVEIHALPRWLGLSRLQWGRVHGADDTFVFTSVTRRDAAPWHRAALWRGTQAPIEWNTFSLEDRDDGTRLRRGDQPSKCADDFMLGSEHSLRDGDTMDEDRFPNLAERHVYRCIMGKARERRWAGSARLAGAKCASPLAAIHESIDF